MDENKSKKPGCVINTLIITLGWVPALVVLVITGIILLEAVLTTLGRLLITADPLQKADAIVVLSGGSDRLTEAAQLFDQKYSGLIILTETGEVNPEYGKYSEMQRLDAMLNLGIPKGAILITEHTVNNTVDEAHVVRKLMQLRHLNSLIVVTDPFHSRRTRIIFHDQFQDSGITVMIHPVPESWYKSATWWISRIGWETTIGEYVRLFYYLIRYQ